MHHLLFSYMHITPKNFLPLWHYQKELNFLSIKKQLTPFKVSRQKHHIKLPLSIIKIAFKPQLHANTSIYELIQRLINLQQEYSKFDAKLSVHKKYIDTKLNLPIAHRRYELFHPNFLTMIPCWIESFQCWMNIISKATNQTLQVILLHSLVPNSFWVHKISSSKNNNKGLIPNENK